MAVPDRVRATMARLGLEGVVQGQAREEHREGPDVSGVLGGSGEVVS